MRQLNRSIDAIKEQLGDLQSARALRTADVLQSVQNRNTHTPPNIVL